MLSAQLDHWLARYTQHRAKHPPNLPGTVWITTPVGRLRVLDTQSSGPCIVLTPDGPNVIEHYLPLLAHLASDYRVVCFDMPGFGLSLPAPSYSHSLNDGAHAVLHVLDALHIARATLAFSCANGFYALRVAQQAPHRVHSLFLSQTPSLTAMHAWAQRTVPRVIGLPLVGQFAGWALRRRAAHAWYRAALPAHADPGPMRQQARHAFACGACFSLAGVVQALMRESNASLTRVQQPCTALWGSADRTHLATSAQSLQDLVPHASIVIASNCGHFPDVEQPQRYANLLRQHLRTC